MTFRILLTAPPPLIFSWSVQRYSNLLSETSWYFSLVLYLKFLHLPLLFLTCSTLNHLSGSTVNFQYSVLVWSLLSLILSSWVNSALGFIAELGWNSVWFRESLYMHMCMWERERENALHSSISYTLQLNYLQLWICFISPVGINN